LRTLPRGYRARIEDGIDDSGWPRAILAERDDSTLSLVPEGTFIMGSNSGTSSEAPAHRVRLRAYYIDQHEVTVDQFEKFLEQTGYRSLLPRNWTPTTGKTRPDPANPVVMVTFKDAQAYAEWCHRELPTEAQWEMAARSEASRLYPWGSEPIDWDKPRGFHQIDPVKSFPQDVSAYGVFDLAGNAAEWTQDWYDSRHFLQLAGDVTVDPTGPARGSRSLQRVVKGGGKNGAASAREGVFQEKRLGYLGFRCVLNLDSGSAPAAPTRPAAPASSPDLAPPPF
jgi:formylglycine-generating enzyme required for sulfatase activity